MLAVAFDATLNEGDLVRSASGALVSDRDLETMVLLSIFCDAPARAGDGADPNGERKGWWGDAFASNGDVVGSRFWLLKRSKLIPETERRGKRYVEEALAWMIEDKLARRVDPFCEIRTLARGVRGLFVGADIYRPEERSKLTAGPWLAFREGVA